jgi:hypothetical protein
VHVSYRLGGRDRGQDRSVHAEGKVGRLPSTLPSRSLFSLQPNALQVTLKLTARLVAQQASLDNDSGKTIGSNSTGNGLLANGVFMGLVRHLTTKTPAFVV